MRKRFASLLLVIMLPLMVLSFYSAMYNAVAGSWEFGVAYDIENNFFPNWCRKAVTFSYDDGPETDERLVKIFNESNVKGTFNLCSRNYATPESRGILNSMYAGHEIANHTRSHKNLKEIPLEEAIAEINLGRAKLEAYTGKPVLGFVYPYYNPKVAEITEAVKNSGAVYARPVETTGKFDLPTDFMDWRPTCHHRNLPIYGPQFLGLPDDKTMKLLFVWGHSFEFPIDEKREQYTDTWYIIEDFCKLIKDRTDIWKATNIEIYNYIQAQKNLVMTQTYIYNPSDCDVYIKINGIKKIMKAKEMYYLDNMTPLNYDVYRGKALPGYTLEVNLDAIETSAPKVNPAYQWYFSDNFLGEYIKIDKQTNAVCNITNDLGGKYMKCIITFFNDSNMPIDTVETSPIFVQRAISEQYPHNNSLMLNYKQNIPDYNLFTIDGRSFSVLDYTDDGRVYVLANELYMRASYINSSGMAPYALPAVAKFSQSDMKKQLDRLYGGSVIDVRNAPDYIPAGIKLPQSIIDYIDADAEWLMERGPINPYITDNGIEIQPTILNDYVERFPIGTLSAYEVIKYGRDQKRFGNVGGSSGIWLRTSVNKERVDLSDQNEQYKCQLYLSKAGNIESMFYHYELYYRPSFYLHKEFFKHNRVDYAGDEIKAYITTLNTDGELAALGYTQQEIDEIVGFRTGIKSITGDQFEEIDKAEGSNVFNVALNVNNFEKMDKTIKVVGALYNSEGALKEIKIDSIILNKDILVHNPVVKFTFENTAEQGDYFKAMVFDELTNIKPLCPSMQK